MRILHRYFIWTLPSAARTELLNAGVRVQDVERVGFIELFEDSPEFPYAKSILNDLDVNASYETIFDESDLAEADWLVMSASELFGTPQPSVDNRWLETSFNLRDYCSTCGAGMHQSNPITLDFIPNLRVYKTWTANWIENECFVDLATWRSLSYDFAFDFWPVAIEGLGTVDNVGQIRVERIHPLNLDLDRFRKELCPICERAKFLLEGPGAIAATIQALDNVDCFVTEQYFGSGGVAERKIVVSNRLCVEIRTRCIPGLLFTPLALSV